MALENNLDANNEIAQFLEKFKDTPRPQPPVEQDLFSQPAPNEQVRPAQYARSFEKLEQKIHELEEKFEASTTQNHLILSELSRTREAMERQKDKDAFLEHISRTIATLRTSVDNLTRTQETRSFAFRENPVQRSFDPLPADPLISTETVAMRAAEQEVTRLREERAEQDRLFSSLRQKASQLKAVNSALDREIKKAQQEKLDALKKSADQAKEILSLRDQLTAAEERFNSFDFEGRIISIKREYQQKVSTLESQLKEMSDTCMRQVEEIESLKAKNTELQAAAAEKDSLQAQLAAKDQQLTSLKNTIASLQTQQTQKTSSHEKQLADYTARLRTLEEQRTQLSLALEQSQLAVSTLRQEKEVLEQNFKELVIKINHNDAIIGQLKEKIDVLGRQNTELSHRNTELAQRNQALTQTASVLKQDNEKLSTTNTHLKQDNSSLAKQNLDLTKDNQTLRSANQNLARDNDALTKTNLHLTHHNEELAQKASAPQPPHMPLQTTYHTGASVSTDTPNPPARSAALLAARLVQEHVQKKVTVKQKDPVPPATATVSAALHQPQEPMLHSLGRNLSKISVPAEEEWEVISAQPTGSKPVQTEADLPEIKVAEPIAQNELFDGEDFLEKTDSFIGRMKWSIFRENR